jgi:MFS family permease
MYTIDWAQVLGGAPRDAAASESRPAPRTPARLLPRVSAVVWSLGFTSMLTDISSEMVSSILPMYLVLHLGLSPLAFGVIDGLYQGVAALLRIAAGIAGDRWQRHKHVAAVGYALSAVCKLGVLAAGNAWGVIAAVVALDRTGKGIRTAPRDALITLSTPAGELGTAFGVHRALDAAGAMLGPLAAFLVLAALPGAFDVVFLASFAVAVIGVAVIVLFVHAPRDERTAAAPRPGATLRDAARLLRLAPFRGLFVAAALLGIATMSDAFVFIVLQQRVGFSAALFPLLYVGVSLVNFVIAVPGGGLADRTGRMRVFLGGYALLLAVYGILMLPAIGIAHVIACLVLLGAYYAATDGVLAAMTGASLPAERCGSGLALLATASNTARLGASVVFGWIWAAYGVTSALAVFAAGLMAALGITIFMLVRATAVTDDRASGS